MLLLLLLPLLLLLRPPISTVPPLPQQLYQCCYITTTTSTILIPWPPPPPPPPPPEIGLFELFLQQEEKLLQRAAHTSNLPKVRKSRSVMKDCQRLKTLRSISHHITPVSMRMVFSILGKVSLDPVYFPCDPFSPVKNSYIAPCRAVKGSEYEVWILGLGVSTPLKRRPLGIQGEMGMDKNMFRVSETWRFGESVTCTSRVSGNLLSAGLFKARRKVRLYCTCPSFLRGFQKCSGRSGCSYEISHGLCWNETAMGLTSFKIPYPLVSLNFGTIIGYH